MDPYYSNVPAYQHMRNITPPSAVYNPHPSEKLNLNLGAAYGYSQYHKPNKGTKDYIMVPPDEYLKNPTMADPITQPRYPELMAGLGGLQMADSNKNANIMLSENIIPPLTQQREQNKMILLPKQQFITDNDYASEPAIMAGDFRLPINRKAYDQMHSFNEIPTPGMPNLSNIPQVINSKLSGVNIPSSLPAPGAMAHYNSLIGQIPSFSLPQNTQIGYIAGPAINPITALQQASQPALQFIKKENTATPSPQFNKSIQQNQPNNQEVFLKKERNELPPFVSDLPPKIGGLFKRPYEFLAM